jgi:hypothetical protein
MTIQDVDVFGRKGPFLKMKLIWNAIFQSGSICFENWEFYPWAFAASCENIAAINLYLFQNFPQFWQFKTTGILPRVLTTL